MTCQRTVLGKIIYNIPFKTENSVFSHFYVNLIFSVDTIIETLIFYFAQEKCRNLQHCPDDPISPNITKVQDSFEAFIVLEIYIIYTHNFAKVLLSNLYTVVPGF